MKRRPVIGITSDVRVEKRTLGFVFLDYVNRIHDAGGLPLQLPPLGDESLISSLLAPLDGVVIVGGEDLDPRLYGEEPLPTHDPVPAERGAFDVALARGILDSGLPVLGICYGCQILAVVSGGALVQDIPSQVGTQVAHGGKFPDLPTHEISVRPGTRLHEILGAELVEVNSAHHQAPKRLGRDWTVTATAADGVVEAFEVPGERFLVGVEWHPELMPERDDQRRLFTALVTAASDRPKSAKRLGV